MGRYGAAIFLSAFLLFQVQPLLGRFILPWFGGGAAVWTTCMLFFQLALLGGYGYAHAIATRISPRRQAALHASLLVLSLACIVLGIAPAESWRPSGAEAPVRGILTLLMVSAGIPFVILSATGPLLQRWFSWQRPGLSPYRLYALSNAGSLLGLLTYPFVLEPALGLRHQALLWSAGYGVFVVVTIACAVGLRRSAPAPHVDNGTAAGPGTRWSVRLLWLALSGCGSLLLLSVTSQISQDVAPVPLLWVLPLTLYLLSFILCFADDRWYDRRLWGPAFALALVAAVVTIHQGTSTDIEVQVLVYASTLFAGCMVCHGELVRLRPDPSQLTAFYLFVAVGGALGGLFAGLVAPVLFNGLWELHLGLMLGYLLFAWCLLWAKGRPLDGVWLRDARAVAVAGAVALATGLGMHVQQDQAGAIALSRNFFGVLGVYEYDAGDEDWRRLLWHGRVKHGGQMLAGVKWRQPTVYYGPQSGMALAINEHPRRRQGGGAGAGGPGEGLRIGMVGLGVGTVAAYGRSADTIRTYEINPEAVRLSDEYFRFRKDGAAREEIVLGDARISMERELAANNPQRFDVLLLDAFNSDSVPVHLLTREAFEVYWKHLKPDGILAVHISAIYLDLNPVVRGIAEAMGQTAIRITNARDSDAMISFSEWVLVTTNRTFLQNPKVRAAVKQWRPESPPGVVWTDDHSNLIQLLK